MLAILATEAWGSTAGKEVPSDKADMVFRDEMEPNYADDSI
jgi:hypothetical protein